MFLMRHKSVSFRPMGSRKFSKMQSYMELPMNVPEDEVPVINDDDHLTGVENQKAAPVETDFEPALAGDEQAEVETEGDEPDVVKEAKFNEKQQKIFNREIGKEHSKVKSLREKVEKLTSDLESRNPISDETVLAAAEEAGVLPQFIDKSSAEILTKADEVTRSIALWEGALADCFESGKPYVATDGRELSVGALMRHVNGLKANNKRVLDKAEQVRASAASKAREIFALGLKASKGQMVRSSASSDADFLANAKPRAIKPPPSPSASAGRPRGTPRKSELEVEKERASLTREERRRLEIEDELRAKASA